MGRNPIDDLIKDALKDVEYDYSAQDWNAFEEKLDKEGRLFPRVWAVKGIEIVVIALAMFTLINFASTNNPSDYPVNSTKGTIKVNNSIPIVPNVNEAGNPIQKTIESPNVKKESPPIAFSSDPIFKRLKEGPPDKGVLDKVLSNNLNPNFPKLKTENEANLQNALAQSNKTSVPLKTIPNTLITHDLADLNFLKSIQPESPEEFAITAVKTRMRFRPKEKFSTVFKGGGYFSPDMNTSPNSSNMSMGYTLGGTFTADLSENITLETGLGYSFKRFFKENHSNPTSGPKPAGSFYQLNKISMSSVELPLNLQVSFYKTKNWRVYLLGGGSGHLVLWKLNTADQDIVDQSGTLAVNSSHNTNDGGLFQGAEVKDNYYLTANAAVGFERQLDHRSVLFIQPTYKLPIVGLGTDNEKIGSFSLIMGARVTMGP